MLRTTRGIAVTAGSAIAILATTIGIAGAKSDDKQVQGAFTATNFSGAGCGSPLDLCARGRFSGTLHGRIDASATVLQPSPKAGVLAGVADIVIHDARGDLFCTETFVVNGTPGSEGEEGWICQFTGGTRHWQGVRGHIEAYGSAPGGAGRGRYAGKLTLP